MADPYASALFDEIANTDLTLLSDDLLRKLGYYLIRETRQHPPVTPGMNVLEWACAARWIRGKTGLRPFSLAGHEYLREPLLLHHDYKVFEKAAQMGLALWVETPIPTPDGWKRMEDIKVGDLVFDDQGKPTSVRCVSEIFTDHQCFEVVFTDGSTIIADGGHRWALSDEKNYRYKKQVLLTTAELARNIPESKRGKRNRYALPVASSLQTDHTTLPVHPYVLGCWLGDGSNACNQITENGDDAEEMTSLIRECGYRAECRHPDWVQGNAANIIIDPVGTNHGTPNTLFKQLRSANLLKNKHIPAIFLRASYDQRLALLQGLMDTDGHITPLGICRYYSSDYSLAKQVYELLMTLGLKGTLTNKPNQPSRIQGRQEMITPNGDGYVLTFLAYKHIPVFRLARKLGRQVECDESRRPTETQRRRIVSVTPVATVPTKCIEVDSPSHLYLAGESMIPTHNSELALTTIMFWMDTIPRFRTMYLFPTDQSVRDFSRDRVDGAINDSPYLVRRCSGIRNVGVKRIGRGLLYMRGMFSKKQVKSVPSDANVFDEIDESQGANKAQAIERLSHSSYGYVIELSTPTIPSRGIDIEFQRSDRRFWHIECHCPEGLVVEKLFPECIGIRDGEAFIYCPTCGKEYLQPQVGAVAGEYRGWIPDLPEVRARRGYHINQFLSSIISTTKIWNKYALGDDIGEFYNSCLGLPYAGDRMPLQEKTVLSACGDIARQATGDQVYVGIDVGPHEWYIVVHARNQNTGARQMVNAEVIRAAEHGGHCIKRAIEIIKGYRRPHIVIDANPERSESRRLCEAFPDKAFMCFYSESTKDKITIGEGKHDDGEWSVVAHRTETLDDVVFAIKKAADRLPGYFLLHPNEPIMKTIALHLGSVAKVKKQQFLQADTGRQPIGYAQYVYVESSADHFFHAINYAIIAEAIERPEATLTFF